MKATDTTDERVKSQRVTARRQTKRLGMRQSQHSGEQKATIYGNLKRACQQISRFDIRCWKGWCFA